MSKRYGRVLAAIVEGLSALEHPWRRAHTRVCAANALAQRHAMNTPHGPLVFVTTHAEALQFPRDLATREPETNAWIDSFETPCTFWDVGANVGTYSLYASLRRGVSVLAFEPSAASYAALCRNVEANDRAENVQAFCVALSGRTRLGSLNMSSTDPGNSFNSFESTEDCFGRPLAVQFRQPAIGFTIDDFRRLFDLPPPNYLKIDVDGIEEEILDGAAGTLTDPGLRSVLIELVHEETPRNARIVERIERAGFVLRLRSGDHGGGANAIFSRNQ